MIFNTILSSLTSRNSAEKRSANRASRSKYIIEKYQERSITNRYFK